jgi:hypothetical protein
MNYQEISDILADYRNSLSQQKTRLQNVYNCYRKEVAEYEKLEEQMNFWRRMSNEYDAADFTNVEHVCKELDDLELARFSLLILLTDRKPFQGRTEEDDLLWEKVESLYPCNDESECLKEWEPLPPLMEAAFHAYCLERYKQD